MDPIFLYSYVEDPPSAAVARRIVEYANKKHGVFFRFKDGFPVDQHGYGNIIKKMPKLVEMAKSGIHSFIISDLDRAECAPARMRDWLNQRYEIRLKIPTALIFRIAVREIESWIMADRENLASFIGIAAANFSKDPDMLPDPKQHLLNVIRQKGKKKWHQDMLPQSPTATIGPLYNEKICLFVKEHWNPTCAESISPSLARAIKAFDR
jgi:hypothetical protein